MVLFFRLSNLIRFIFFLVLHSLVFPFILNFVLCLFLSLMLSPIDAFQHPFCLPLSAAIIRFAIPPNGRSFWFQSRILSTQSSDRFHCVYDPISLSLSDFRFCSFSSEFSLVDFLPYYSSQSLTRRHCPNCISSEGFVLRLYTPYFISRHFCYSTVMYRHFSCATVFICYNCSPFFNFPIPRSPPKIVPLSCSYLLSSGTRCRKPFFGLLSQFGAHYFGSNYLCPRHVTLFSLLLWLLSDSVALGKILCESCVALGCYEHTFAICGTYGCVCLFHEALNRAESLRSPSLTFHDATSSWDIKL